MNCWESFYMQVLQQQTLWIYEQKTNKLKPLNALANVTNNMSHNPTPTPTQYTPDQHNSNINKMGKSIFKQIYSTFPRYHIYTPI